MGQTTDYYQVYQDIHALAAKKPRKLLEHFAHEIAEAILGKYKVKAVEIEIRKFILPETAHVAVRIKRKR
ncbi:dihydroneopterin aldolase [Kamptonema cortianum]|nr:dihydroneopterin aldolase [Kamptonema cortianum]